MDFEKKFPLTQSPDKVITVQWTRGYNQIQVLYNGEIIGEHTGAKDLKKGVQIPSNYFGSLEIKLGGEPLRLNVLVDGLHSPANSMHPKFEVKGIASYFWILFGAGLLLSVLSGIQINFNNPVALITTFLDFLILVGYLLAAILLPKGKPGAFYLGFIPFCFTSLLSLLMALRGGFLPILVLVVRSIFVVILIKSIKPVLSLSRHNRYGTFTNVELLDEKI